MVRHMSATEARVHFGELLRAVSEERDHVVVERSGQPVAVVLSPQRFAELSQRDDVDAILQRAEQSRQLVARWLDGKPLPDIDELIDAGHGHDDDE